MRLDQLSSYRSDALDLLQAVAKIARDRVPALLPGIVTATTNFPTGAGLSSSAAIALAATSVLFRANGIEGSHQDIAGAAFDAETGELKTGAGWMDFLACLNGGVSSIDASERPNCVRLTPGIPVSIIVVDTLQPRSTSEILSIQLERFRSRERGIISYEAGTSQVVDELTHALTHREPDLEHVGRLVTQAHVLLRDYLKCSTALLDSCVDRCIQAGALGAKLTGSGHGGCLFALAFPDAVPFITSALEDLPVQTFVTSFDERGLVDS